MAASAAAAAAFTEQQERLLSAGEGMVRTDREGSGGGADVETTVLDDFYSFHSMGSSLVEEGPSTQRHQNFQPHLPFAPASPAAAEATVLSGRAQDDDEEEVVSVPPSPPPTSPPHSALPWGEAAADNYEPHAYYDYGEGASVHGTDETKDEDQGRASGPRELPGML